MQLTARNLSELVRELRSTSREGEKRKTPRVGLRAKAQIVVQEKTMPVWIKDLSAGGANLSTPQPIEADTFFELLLSDTDKIGCTVTHCRQHGANLYSIGARFTQDVTRRNHSR